MTLVRVILEVFEGGNSQRIFQIFISPGLPQWKIWAVISELWGYAAKVRIAFPFQRELTVEMSVDSGVLFSDPFETHSETHFFRLGTIVGGCWVSLGVPFRGIVGPILGNVLQSNFGTTFEVLFEGFGGGGGGRNSLRD